MENINIDDIKKIGNRLEKKTVELTDDDLENINGGFKETNKKLYSFGFNIKCPKCGKSGANDFYSGVKVDDTQKSVEYHCKCGCQFIFKDGYAVIKEDWVGLCSSKGYTYKA